MTETVIMISAFAAKMSITAISLTLLAIALELDRSIPKWLAERRELRTQKAAAAAS